MLRVLIAVLAWPALIFFTIWAFEWFDQRYLNPPDENAVFEYDHPRYTSMALDALEQFAALDPEAQDEFRHTLQDQLVPVEHWVEYMQQKGFAVLCVGEDHIDLTRNYLAEHIFSRLPVDVLYLEATPSELTDILGKVNQGQDKVDLLGADIAVVVRAALAANQNVVFRGIEETNTQKEARFELEDAGIRDDSIVKNVWDSFRPEKRHLILFGAIHCNNWPKWMYQKIRASAPPEVLADTLNIKVVERKQDSLIDPFLYFLDEIGMERRDFVIVDTSELDPLLLNWFSLMVPQIFSQYETLLVYRSPSP